MIAWFKQLRRVADAIAGIFMLTIFTTFIFQVVIRYSARLSWIADAVPILEPSNFGWTLEFCLALWVWLIFFGNAFVVRDQDHVSFDILYLAVRPRIRKWFIIIGGLAIIIALVLSIAPTLDRFYILRLKRTATLSNLFGDWVRMRHVYMIYILFLIVIPLRYALAIWQAIRHGAHLPEQDDEQSV